MVEGASYRDHTVKSMVAGEDPALEQSGDVAEVDVSSDPKDRVESSDLTRSESVSLDRKVLAVPQQEEDSNLCAICLDEYTDEDPAISTCCGHAYHLQCIMQWSQRSRECPLCFHSLRLEDDTMNSLLPFGEYVDPRQAATTAAMLETWELERFLVRLASAERRASRHSRQRRATMPVVGETAESAPPQLNRSSARVIPTDRVSGGAQGTDASAGYPASWPPRGGRHDGEGGSSRDGGGGETSASPMQGLKSRLASLRISTARELKSLFGSPSAPRHQ